VNTNSSYVITRLCFILLMLILPVSGEGSTFSYKEYFNNYLRATELRLRFKNFPGPLSQCIARVALARQVLEDGINRKPTESIAGISIGGFNKTILESTKYHWIKVNVARDSEGGKFYSLSGFRANVCSAVVIGRLYDYYVGSFLKHYQKVWILSKETSKAISMDPDSFELNHRFYVVLNPSQVVEKADLIFGPNHTAVMKIAYDYSGASSYKGESLENEETD